MVLRFSRRGPLSVWVLIFGEDQTDRGALEHLSKAILAHAGITGVRTSALRKPIILSRHASKRKRHKMSAEVAGFARAFERKAKTLVVVHQDCDDVEPAHLREAARLDVDLRAAGVVRPVPATPAWEIEAWWMLFPRALMTLRPRWRTVDYGGQNVGLIANAKERLRNDLRPIDRADRHRCPDFEPSDGVRLAQLISRELGFLAEIRATSESFQAFRTRLVAQATS